MRSLISPASSIYSVPDESYVSAEYGPPLSPPPTSPLPKLPITPVKQRNVGWQPCSALPPPRPPRPQTSLPNLRPRLILDPVATRHVRGVHSKSGSSTPQGNKGGSGQSVSSSIPYLTSASPLADAQQQNSHESLSKMAEETRPSSIDFFSMNMSSSTASSDSEPPGVRLKRATTEATFSVSTMKSAAGPQQSLTLYPNHDMRSHSYAPDPSKASSPLSTGPQNQEYEKRDSPVSTRSLSPISKLVPSDVLKLRLNIPLYPSQVFDFQENRNDSAVNLTNLSNSHITFLPPFPSSASSRVTAPSATYQSPFHNGAKQSIVYSIPYSQTQPPAYNPVGPSPQNQTTTAQESRSYFSDHEDDEAAAEEQRSSKRKKKRRRLMWVVATIFLVLIATTGIVGGIVVRLKQIG